VKAPSCAHCGAAVALRPIGAAIAAAGRGYCSLGCLDAGPWRCPVAEGSAPTWCCDHPSRFACLGADRCVLAPDSPGERLAGWCFCGCHVAPHDAALGRLEVARAVLRVPEGVTFWGPDGRPWRGAGVPLRATFPRVAEVALAERVEATWPGHLLGRCVRVPGVQSAAILAVWSP
jgi:hypothetical protein